MVQITHYLAQVIFLLYRDRFDTMDKVSDLKDQCEVLLPHGVKLTKNKRKYYIKYYSSGMRDWNMFCIGLGLRVAEIADDHVQILPKLRPSLTEEVYKRVGPSVIENEDGSASFGGELIGMGF